MGLRAALLSPVLTLSGRKGTQNHCWAMPSSSSSHPIGLMVAQVAWGRAPGAMACQGQVWGTWILAGGQVPLAVTLIVRLRAHLWFGLSSQEP